MAFQPEVLWEAVGYVFSINTFFWIAVGVTIGVGIGAIPGLSASTGVALMLPLTLQMDVASALGLMISIYKGSEFGGSISAISFSVPGTPAAAATIYDGYKLMQKGQGRKAILMALYASCTGDMLASLLTIFVAPALAIAALKFGPSERFWVVFLAFTLLGVLSGRHLAKGLLSAAIGFFLAMIGTDPIAAIPRVTFGIWWLQDGIYIISLLIGIFAMSRMIEDAVDLLRERRVSRGAEGFAWTDLLKGGEGLSLREYLRCWKEMVIGFFIGSFMGIVPGLGGTAAAFLSYGVAKQVSPNKSLGKGVIEGVAAPESANNATVGPALVPLLAFGIPGTATAALIGGSLTFHGATPSPRMFELYPSVVYSIFLILIVSNIFNLGIGRLFAFVYSRLGQIPKPMMIPIVIMIAIIGVYSIRESPYDLIIMLAIGVVGFVLRRFNIPDTPLVITFLISPMAESSLRRALLIAGGDWFHALFSSSLSIGLCLSTVVLAVVLVWLRRRETDLG